MDMAFIYGFNIQDGFFKFFEFGNLVGILNGDIGDFFVGADKSQYIIKERDKDFFFVFIAENFPESHIVFGVYKYKFTGSSIFVIHILIIIRFKDFFNSPAVLSRNSNFDRYRGNHFKARI